VSWYQKGKTNLDFTEARDSEWQWHQLDHMQVCISFHTDNHASTSPLKFFTGWMPFQQRQSTEGIRDWNHPSGLLHDTWPDVDLAAAYHHSQNRRAWSVFVGTATSTSGQAA